MIDITLKYLKWSKYPKRISKIIKNSPKTTKWLK